MSRHVEAAKAGATVALFVLFGCVFPWLTLALLAIQGVCK